MRNILHLLFAIVSVCIAYGCGKSGHEGPAEAVEGDEIASMVTHDVTMLISDSGVIKYKAITPLWVRYGEEAKEPYQYFPEGIVFEQLDSVFEAKETIVADTAYNWENKQLWHLIRNVRVTSVMGEVFETNDLFWDMRSHKVYSDSFIHIERQQNIIEGYGFTSTDDFSKYEIRQTSGVFPAKEDNAQQEQ